MHVPLGRSLDQIFHRRLIRQLAHCAHGFDRDGFFLAVRQLYQFRGSPIAKLAQNAHKRHAHRVVVGKVNCVFHIYLRKHGIELGETSQKVGRHLRRAHFLRQQQ